MRATLALLIIAVLFVCCNEKRPNQKQSFPATQSIVWIKDSTGDFTVLGERGVIDKNNLHQYLLQAQNEKNELLNLLNEASYPDKLNLHFVKDRKTLARLTNYEANGYTNVYTGDIYFVYKPPRAIPMRHEVMHALSWRLWGDAKEFWLSEGICIWASRCRYNLHSIANNLLAGRGLQAFDTLVKNFDFRKLEPQLQSASMVQYIADKYDLNVLKRFWKEGLSASNRIIGISPKELEQQWTAFIAQPKFNTAVDLVEIKQKGCE